MIKCDERPACSGCDLFDTTFDSWRAEIGRALEQTGAPYSFDSLPSSWHPSPERHAFRRRARMVVSHAGELGFYQRGSQTFLPIQKCVVHSDEIESALQNVRTFLANNKPAHEITRFVDVREADNATFVTFCVSGGLPTNSTELFDAPEFEKLSVFVNNTKRATDAVMSGEQQFIRGLQSATWTVGDDTFLADVEAFFQVNPPVLADIHTYIREKAVPFDSVLDLYCGVGVHGLRLAGPDTPIMGFDFSDASIRSARDNSRDRGRKDDTWLRARDDEPAIFDVPSNACLAILNPGRSGAHRNVISFVRENAAKMSRVFYISCEPRTLFRDLSRLQSHFEVASLAAFEMIPRTSHVELVAELIPRETPAKIGDANGSWVARLVGKAPNSGALPKNVGQVQKLRRIDGDTIVRIDSSATEQELRKACRAWGYPVLGDTEHGTKSANFAAARDHFLDRPVLEQMSGDYIPPFLLQFLALPPAFFVRGGGFWKR